MAGMSVVWIEQPPTVEIDGAGVRVEYASGDKIYVRRMSRAVFRRTLEASLRQLNAYEAAERRAKKVVRLGH